MTLDDQLADTVDCEIQRPFIVQLSTRRHARRPTVTLRISAASSSADFLTL